jgi:trimethylamine:corrinoid methyltransferase-like protein
LPANVCGLCGSGNAIDIQSGHERAMSALLPMLTGADEISGVSEMAGGVFSCPAQMVIDDENIAMIQRVGRGFVVEEKTLEVTASVMDGAQDVPGRRRHARPHAGRGVDAGVRPSGRIAAPVLEQHWRSARGPRG